MRNNMQLGKSRRRQKKSSQVGMIAFLGMLLLAGILVFWHLHGTSSAEQAPNTLSPPQVLEPNSSELKGSTNSDPVSVATAPNPTSPLLITYDIPREAAVSLGLFDNQGRLLRHLIKAKTRAAGRNQEWWDGLDQWGNVVQEGQYQLKGAYFDPLRLEYVMTATNPGDPPWWTADGTGGWLSDQSAAQDIVTDGTNVYIAVPGTEAGHGLIAVGPDGKRIWGVNNPSHGFPRAVSLTLFGDRLYAMYSGPSLTGGARSFRRGDQHAIGQATIMCFDKYSGALAGPSVRSGRPIRLTTWEYRHDIHALWDLRLNQRFSPATYGGQHRYSYTEMCETTNALGLTAVGERLVASMFYDNELLVLDPDSLDILKRIAVEAPAGLHGLDGQQLLAVSGTRVVRVNVESGTVQTVIEQGLSAPFGVSTDRDGTIYVSDWGDSFQVKAFDATGSLLRAIGKAGGRPWVGPWVAEGMAVPRGLAITDNNRLWVAEDEFSPRRVSVWDAATGVLIRDYIGPANYEGWGLAIDPLNPRRIITTGTEFLLDFENQTYTPTRKMFLRRSRDDAFMINGNEMGQFARIIYREGREFYVTGKGGLLVILERRGDEYRAVAGVSRHEYATTIDGTSKSVWDSDLGRHFLPDWYPEFFKGQAGNNHIWNDLNGDGIMQANEMFWDNTLRRGDAFQPGRMGEFGPSWGVGFGPDFEIYLTAFCRGVMQVYRLDPEFTEDGLPRYSFDRARPIIHHDTSKQRIEVENLYASNSGKLFVTYHEDDRFRQDFENGIVCYDRDGNELWAIAHSRDRDFDSLSESLWGYPNAEFRYPDLGSGVVTWEWRRRRGRVYLLSDDGLYLGALLDNHGDMDSSYRQVTSNEISKYAFQKPDGRLYLVNGANSAHHILEIQGLETAKRFEMPLIITKQDAIAAAQALEMEATFEAGQPVILVERTDAAPPMDGTLTGWDLEAEGVRLRSDHSSRGGQFALKTDGMNLFFAARILDETPMVNNGESWLMPFMSGDCVDLMLAINPEADPGRRSAAPGDLRLLFTELRGEPMAVLYRQSVPGTTNPVQMMATYIDEVRRLPEATPVIRRQADGYTLTARIPLASLGLTTLPQELRGDVGIIYGDASGRNRDQRLYYNNKNTEIVSDLTTEARLHVDRWGLIGTTEPGNLIRNAGFEAELGDTNLGNWRVINARNGASARLTTKSVFAGGRSLLLAQETPITLPENAADYTRQTQGQFISKLNDGKGGGSVQVGQRVSVEGGRRYNLRLAYRAHGLIPEMGGSGRAGYVFFTGSISWLDGNGREIRREEAFRHSSDQPRWRQIFNDRSVWPVAAGQPYTAPANATQAEIRLNLTVNFDSQPEVFIDQVEFFPVRR